MMTEAEILAEKALIAAARQKIYESGQQYTAGPTSNQRAPLDQLNARDRYLDQMLEIVRGGGSYGCQPVVFGGRR